MNIILHSSVGYLLHSKLVGIVGQHFSHSRTNYEFGRLETTVTHDIMAWCQENLATEAMDGLNQMKTTFPWEHGWKRNELRKRSDGERKRKRKRQRQRNEKDWVGVAIGRQLTPIPLCHSSVMSMGWMDGWMAEHRGHSC